MKIGLVGKDNYKGLGTLTEGFVRHLPIHRLMCIGKNQRKRYSAIYTHSPESVWDSFIEGLDVVIFLEMEYQQLLRRCKEKGVKTILKVNYEFLRTEQVHKPDKYACSSSKNMQAVKYPNKILIPDPIELKKFPFKQRKKVKTILINAGTGGIGDANGMEAIKEAIPLVKSNVKFLVNTQIPFNVKDKRVVINHGKVEDNADLYKEGDVFLLPQRFRATSLPIQEAMACGMPIITTDLPPFNEYCPFLVEVTDFTQEWSLRPIEVYKIDAQKLANKIDDVVGLDISDYSIAARQHAVENWDWKKISEKYIALCNSLML